MRTGFDHGIPEFSDLRCRMSGLRPLRSEGPCRSGLRPLRSEGPCQSKASPTLNIEYDRFDEATPCRGLGGRTGHAGLVLTGPDWSWYTHPGTPSPAPPWVPLPCHPGYTTWPWPSTASVPHGHGLGTKRVLWALKWHCVTLKTYLSSI